MIYPWQREAWIQTETLVPRLPHALLIHGVAGIGKLAFAEHLAQRLLCEASNDQPCGRCSGCRWFGAGNHPDFRRVVPEALAREEGAEEGAEPRARKARPSSEIKIDQVRALADFLNIGSHRGGRRIALVYPAEDMNVSAGNALLKGLEEPPPGAVFLLVSHRAARLLPTVRSRCVPLPLALPEPGAARVWLEAQGVAGAERWLAYAGGAPLRALEYASGESGERLARLLEPLQRMALDRLPGSYEREDLEALAEALQKLALDRAFSALAGRAKYLPGATGGTREQAFEWLAFARRLGRHRALARHPLNPALFAAQLISEIPGPR